VPVNLLPEGLGAGGIQSMLTDQNGHFLFKIADSLALDSFVLQAKQKQGERLNIKLDKYHSPGIEKQVQEPDTEQTAESAIAVNTYSKAAANELRASGKGSIRNESIRLKEVKIKDYNPVKKLVNSTSANLNGPGHADVVLTGKDVEKFPNLSSLSAFLPGVKISNGGPGISMSLTSTVGTHTDGVLILVDGQAGNTLDEISPRDVESIEFMKSPVYAGIYGIRGAGGVLLITTKKGRETKDLDTTIARHILPLRLSVNIAREFYSPKYDKPESADTPIDSRTTVYWNPEIVTDKNGKAIVQYYNTDVPGNYQVVIEGISAKGHLCRQVFNYTVE
jgi:TonB-dependent SusC/RagA subfamily outer membrane receptor